MVEIGYMNPNGQNQLWSKWTFEISHIGLGVSKHVTREEVKSNFARFATKLFGSAGAMRILKKGGKLVVEVLVENTGVTPHDDTYTSFVRQQATAFFVAGFGPDTHVKVKSKIMAGSRQDGKPADQMLIMPSINLKELAGS